MASDNPRSRVAALTMWRVIAHICALAVVTLLVAHARAQDPTVPVLVRKVTVKDELGHPVVATLDLLAPDNSTETYFADTNDDGVASPNKRCQPGMRVKAHPLVDAYLKPPRYDLCSAVVTIVLRRSGVAFALARIGDKAYASGQFGRAALVYTDAAYSLSNADKTVAAQLELKAYKAIGKQFGDTTLYKYDPLQGKAVLTPTGVKALKAFQSNENLPVTGRLDVRTTRALAGGSVFSDVFSAYKAVEKQNR